MSLDHGSITPALSPERETEIRRIARIQQSRTDFRSEFALVTMDVSSAADGTFSNSYKSGLVKQHAFPS